MTLQQQTPALNLFQRVSPRRQGIHWTGMSVFEFSVAKAALKKGVFGVVIILFGYSALAIGDEIRLITGKTIHTNKITKKNGQITYETQGGYVSFPASMVKKIIYGKPWLKVSAPAQAPTRDLSEQLLKVMYCSRSRLSIRRIWRPYSSKPRQEDTGPASLLVTTVILLPTATL